MRLPQIPWVITLHRHRLSALLLLDLMVFEPPRPSTASDTFDQHVQDDDVQ